MQFCGVQKIMRMFATLYYLLYPCVHIQQKGHGGSWAYFQDLWVCDMNTPSSQGKPEKPRGNLHGRVNVYSYLQLPKLRIEPQTLEQWGGNATHCIPHAALPVKCSTESYYIQQRQHSTLYVCILLCSRCHSYI